MTRLHDGVILLPLPECFAYFLLLVNCVPIQIAKRTVTIYRPKLRQTNPTFNLDGFLMSHFLLLEMQE
jgi:hypothetical protein